MSFYGGIDRGELRFFEGIDGEGRTYWSGCAWQLGTARFWEVLAEDTCNAGSYRLGATLREELAACIVGGFGATWNHVQPFIDRLRSEGLLVDGRATTQDDIYRALVEPVVVDGRAVRYRFPAQRSERLANAFSAIDGVDVERMSDLQLRDFLLTVRGVGLKTASWVVRNLRASDQVAIIDVHIARAGVVAGVFDAEWRVARDYLRFERAFLAWSQHARVEAPKLDATIWAVLSGRNSSSQDILGVETFSSNELLPVWPVLDEAG